MASPRDCLDEDPFPPVSHTARSHSNSSAAQRIKTEIAGWLDDGTLKVRLQLPAQDDKANPALLAFLPLLVSVSKNQISNLRGETGRQKVIAFGNLSDSQMQRLPSR